MVLTIMNTEREDCSVVCVRVWQIFCFGPPGEGDQSEADLLFSFTPYLQSYLYPWHRATGATQTISPLSNSHIDTFCSHTYMYKSPAILQFLYVFFFIIIIFPVWPVESNPTHPHNVKSTPPQGCSEGELYSFKGSGPSVHVKACFTYQSISKPNECFCV